MRIEAVDIRAEIEGHVALTGATVSFDSASVHGIVGPNGSGKSTLLHILSGHARPRTNFEGKLYIDGCDVLWFYNRGLAKLKGIFLVAQEPAVIDGLSVIENALLGCEDDRYFAAWKKKAALEQVAGVLEKLGWNLEFRDRCGELCSADKQKLAIVRVLLTHPEPSFILFDEPTTHLSPDETIAFFRTAIRLSERGIGIVVVSHKLGDIVSWCNRVSVLKAGRVEITHELRADNRQRIADEIVGHRATRRHHDVQVSTKSPVVRVDIEEVWDGIGRSKIKKLSFEVFAGEVLGLLGNPDDGLDELFDLLSGTLPADQFDATLMFSGEVFTFADVSKRRQAGFSFIPARKISRALIPGLTIQENVLLSDLPGRWIWNSAAETKADQLCSALHIHRSRLFEDVTHLSGGYQQRVVLARELGRRPKVLVMHNPSQGIDVETRSEVYEHLVRCQRRGCAVVLVSSDEDEIQQVATRSLSLRNKEAMAP